jgi:UDP-glucose 4-epimerase
VSDVVDALVPLSIIRTRRATKFNVGMAEEISILELAECIRERVRSTSPIELIPYDRATSALRGHAALGSRHGEVASLAGWAPRHGLDGILDGTFAEERLETGEPAASG